MRKTTFAFAFAATMVAICAAAPCAQAAVGDTFSSGTSTAITYKVTADPAGDVPGAVQVGDGSAVALDASYLGSVSLPEYVDYKGARYAVTAVGANAFMYGKLASVTLPGTVETVLSQAFYGCSNLASIDFGSDSHLRLIGAKAFQLPSVTGGIQGELRIPASVESIGAYAFSGQASMTSLSFEAESMDSIGERAFEHCSSLKKAEVPGLTAQTNSYGCAAFYNDNALELVVYKGDITSSGNTDGSKTFDNCTNLKTVVFRKKKVIPYVVYGNNFTNFIFTYTQYFKYSDPTLYYTVTYYGSKEDAEAGERPLGSVCVRDDVRLADLSAGLAVSGAGSGAVYDGEVCQLPAGYSGWAFEGSPQLGDAIPDSLYAYPVDASNLEYASMQAPESQVYTGVAVSISPTVYAASGALLEAGKDYELVFQRKDAAGEWSQTSDLTSAGQIRVEAQGTGAYTGSCSAEFAIEQAAEGSSFVCNGVTYCITQTASLGVPGQVSVGNGSDLAVGSDYSGSLSIPAAVSPEGSQLVYQVTSVADMAFGGATSQAACAGLSSVELPASVTSLGNSSFAHCEMLTGIVIPAGVTTLGARCFQGCISLASLEFLGDELESMGAFCFEECASLKSVVLPSVANVAGRAFANCVGCVSVTFKGSFGGADGSQFAGCTRLKSISWGTACYRVAATGEAWSATYLAYTGNAAVAVIPAAVTPLGVCPVTAVGAKAFAGTKATVVTVKSKTVTSFKSAFKGSQVTKVKVPKAKLAVYKKLLTKAKCGKKVAVSA